LRFISDAGQTLYLPQKDGNTDYTRVVDVWEHFHEDDAPIPERWVTYNFRLSPEDSEEERELALSLDWGAEVVSLPAGSLPMYLCQGTADTCPTGEYVARQDDMEEGLLTIGDDQIEVSGISAKQGYVTAAIEQLSQKPINFV
jgi:hypothetical protein